LSRVEDELYEISLINQILEVSSEGLTADDEMAHPVMKGAKLPRSGSLRVLRERSTRSPDPRLVFDGIKHMVDGNPEWNKVRLCSAVPVRFVRASGWSWTTTELWFGFFLGG